MFRIPARNLIFAFFTLGLLGACREANPRYKDRVMYGADTGSKVLSFDAREESPGDGAEPSADLGDLVSDVGADSPRDAVMDTLQIIEKPPDPQPDVAPDVAVKFPVDAQQKDTAPDNRAEVAARDVGIDTARDSQPDVVVTTGLSVQYRCSHTAVNATYVSFSIKIVNMSSRAISLSNFKARYYFLGFMDITAFCDYAEFNSKNVSFVVGTTTGTNPHRYIEISFTADAGTVAAGTVSGVVRVRFQDANGLFQTITQTNDYSFDPTKAETFAEWTRVTLHQSGVLIWGTPP